MSLTLEFAQQKSSNVSNILLTLLILPLAVAALKSVADFAIRRRAEYQRRMTLIWGLIGEIKRIEAQNRQQLGVLVGALNDGTIVGKMTHDPLYFVHIAYGDKSQTVFDDGFEKHSFLKVRCFDSIVEYYDNHSLLIAMLEDQKTDTFRGLDAKRKLAVYSKFPHYAERQRKLSGICVRRLLNERRALRRKAMTFGVFGALLLKSQKLIRLRHHSPQFFRAAHRP